MKARCHEPRTSGLLLTQGSHVMDRCPRAPVHAQAIREGRCRKDYQAAGGSLRLPDSDMEVTSRCLRRVASRVWAELESPSITEDAWLACSNGAPPQCEESCPSPAA